MRDSGELAVKASQAVAYESMHRVDRVINLLVTTLIPDIQKICELGHLRVKTQGQDGTGNSQGAVWTIDVYIWFRHGKYRFDFSVLKAGEELCIQQVSTHQLGVCVDIFVPYEITTVTMSAHHIDEQNSRVEVELTRHNPSLNRLPSPPWTFAKLCFPLTRGYCLFCTASCLCQHSDKASQSIQCRLHCKAILIKLKYLVEASILRPEQQWWRRRNNSETRQKCELPEELMQFTELLDNVQGNTFEDDDIFRPGSGGPTDIQMDA